MILQRKKLGEVIKLEYGKPLPESERRLEGPYPVYGANGIKSHSALSYVNHRSIIVGRKGSAGEVNLTEEKFWPLDVTYFVTYDEEKYDLGFLYRLLASVNLPKLAKGVKPGLNRNDVYSIPVRIPELIDEQKRIAQTIDAADKLRHKRRQAIDLLDTYVQSVFLDMFDVRKHPSVVLESLALDEKGTFSNGPFGSDLLCSELVSKGVPVIYVRDIRNGLFAWKSNVYVTREKAQSLPACQVKKGDLLIAKVGDPPGISAVYPNDELAIMTQDVIRLRPSNLVNTVYLKHWINSEMGKHTLKGITIDGTRSRFSLKDFKKTKVPMPPLQIQNEFASIVTRSETIREKMLVQAQKLEDHFRALMQEAFRS